MSDDELTVVQEELMAAQAEVERLELASADREARAAHLEGQLSELRQELGQSQSAVEAREQELAGTREQVETLRSQVRSSAQRYREAVLQQSPELPGELVTGETVEEVDEAIERARATVSKVRGHLESQAQAGRVPVGAPARSGPDLSAMSAEEKIRFGLQQKGS